MRAYATSPAMHRHQTRIGRGVRAKNTKGRSEKIRRKIEKKERKKDEEIKRKNERNTEVTPDL
jgi:hypothetical protein